MNATDTSITAIAQAIEGACNNRWGVWLSDTGRWWATRHSALPAEALNAGCVPFLRADTSDELAQRIREQEELVAASPGNNEECPRVPPMTP